MPNEWVNKLRATFSVVLFCLLVLGVSYLGWNFVHALLLKFF
ncbi:MAG: hypothetical protein NW237_09140 [Cyanobacteriota bacterium]|nr:hypothetical protein [Cyanobacteriota bacterium]